MRLHFELSKNDENVRASDKHLVKPAGLFEEFPSCCLRVESTKKLIEID